MNSQRIKNKQEKQNKQPFYVKKFKTLITLIILIILLPGYFFFIKPEFNSYQENKKAFDQYEKQREISSKRLLGYKKTISSYQGTSELNKAKINQVLPQDVEEADLYINLESLAHTANLTLNGLTIEPVTDDKKKKPFIRGNQTVAEQEQESVSKLSIIKITMDLSDVSYNKMKHFFDILETNLRLIDVESFSFSPEGGTLNLSLNAYYLKNN